MTALADALGPAQDHDYTPPCADDPELWFSRHGDDKDTARLICETCPVRQHCAVEAMRFISDTRYVISGVWAGVDTEAQSRQVTQRRLMRVTRGGA